MAASVSNSPVANACRALDEVKEIQRRLTERGFKTDGIDGRTGSDTVKAIGAFQKERRHGAGRRLCRPHRFWRACVSLPEALRNRARSSRITG